MVWITMSLAPHAGSKKRKKDDSKPHSQINKCLNEKRRREQENIHIEELAELLSASPSDMSSLSCKPDKCAILKETVNQIRSQKQSIESELCDDLQQSEVSSSKPNIINNQIFGSILLEALEGFLFVVNIDGKVEFVSDNITAFLKYHQDEVFEKNIYDFIHPDDRARFNSNLLLMMPIGNGRDWSPDNNINSPGKPTKHFNCRFLVRPDKPEIKMENKQQPTSQYDNLNITANYIPLGNEGNDTRNGLTCIARRVAVEEKRVSVNKVEQFTTRIDREGKVVDLDTSILSPASGQYLKKELLGSPMLDFCHPSDLPTFKHHLKETLENGVSTCNPFKFRVSRDRYAKVKTKSKRFHCMQPVGEFIISTHSIIRDCDSSSTADSQRSVSSPSSVASTSSGPGSVSDSSTSVNGSVALSPLEMSNNSYGSYPTSTPQNSTEFGLNDLVMDMFPSSNWSLDQNSSQVKENDLTSVTSFVSSPQAAPSSNRSSETSATASPTNSAFVSGLASSRSGSSVPSPAMQSRTPTPFGGSCYSPSASQSSSGRSSPPRALPAKADSMNCSSSETSGINSLSQGNRQERQFDLQSNQKLRNLLTQSSDDSARQMSRQASQEVTVISESRPYEEPPHLSAMNTREATSSTSRPKNVILRDLLNQEDDDSDAPVEPIFRSDMSSVPNPLFNAGVCKGIESGAQHRLGNNNMLRKLLNNDDGDRNYRKSQDIIHQLLIEGSGSRASSYQNENRNLQNVLNPRLLENSVPNAVPAESTRQNQSSEVTFISETSSVKRKMVEKTPPIVSVKRQNSGPPHAHLAGQNPMLASMLAQTPRTPPTAVPTSVASTIMTQLPQERLPKNLEKKLVHTPYTTVPVSGTATTSQAFQNILALPPPLQKGIVTTNAHGQIVRTSFVTGLNDAKSNYLQQIDKILSLEEENMLARQLDLNYQTSSSASVQNSQSFVQQLAQSSSQSSTSVTNSGLSSDLALDSEVSDSAQTSQAADPVFAEILEQIYSLQEEHNLETCGADDRAAILKLLGEVMEPPPSTIAPQQNLPLASTQDLNEKIAISAIQKELMEGAAIAVSSRGVNLQNPGVSATYSQAGRPGTQVSGTSVLQNSLSAETLIILQQQQQQLVTAGALPPNYSLIANRVRLPTTTQSQLLSNPELLAQAQRRGMQLVRNSYMNIGNANNSNINQIRKSMKQRLYLQQQQKRLLEQQQKQQLTMQTQQSLDVINASGANSFAENMNDLLNNTVAPNVTLLRSSDIAEVPGSQRFSITSSNSVPSPNVTSPTPSQLSPGQRVNLRSPFSPLSQQSYPSQTPPPTSYQAAGLSPHPPPSYSQGGPSQSPLPIPPTTSPHMVMSPQPNAAVSPQWNQRLTTSPIQNLQLQNLQLQNPMLNAQLSQQSSIVNNQQVRLTAQQRQQLTLRSMPNQSSLIQVSRNSTLTSQSDNYSPLSPVMVVQSQASHRIQRTLSIPDRIAVSQSQPSLSSESVLSPQSLPSPTYVSASIPASSAASIPSSPSPLTFSTSQNSQHFTFERQNVQAFASSSSEITLRSPASIQCSSDLNRQEIRAIIGGRNQITLSTANLLQSIPSGSTTRVLNVQNLSRETLEELGLTGLLSGTDAQSTSQALYSQALLSVSSNMDSAPQPISSPRVQVEEPRPTDQKKSLLQQLLSEPT